MTHDIPLNRHPLPIRPRAARGRCTRTPWRRGPRPRSGTRRLDVPAPRDRRALGRRRPAAKDAVRLRGHRRHSCGGLAVVSSGPARLVVLARRGSPPRGGGVWVGGLWGQERSAHPRGETYCASEVARMAGRDRPRPRPRWDAVCVSWALGRSCLDGGWGAAVGRGVCCCAFEAR